MSERMVLADVVPEAYEALYGLEKYVRANVDRTTLELIKLRASVLNGCAYCTDLHSREALAAGESDRRLFAVAVWREAPFFDDRERAALALTDEVTRLGEGGVSDDTWEQVRAHWSREEAANLVFAIATINVWNRLGVTARKQPPAAT